MTITNTNSKLSRMMDYHRDDDGDHDDDQQCRCYGCHGPIQDPYILQVYPNLQWHVSCLKCAKCTRRLDNDTSCYVRDGKILCREDYITHFLYRCAGCYQAIKKSDFVMRLHSQTYHVACFKCTICSKVLQTGEEIAFKTGLPYCLADMSFAGYLPRLLTTDSKNVVLMSSDDVIMKCKQQQQQQKKLSTVMAVATAVSTTTTSGDVNNDDEVSPMRKSLMLMNSSTEDGSILEELKLCDDVDDEDRDVVGDVDDEIKEYLSLKPSSMRIDQSRPQSPQQQHQQQSTKTNINGSLVSDMDEEEAADSDDDDGDVDDDEFYDDLEDPEHHQQNQQLRGHQHHQHHHHQKFRHQMFHNGTSGGSSSTGSNSQRSSTAFLQHQQSRHVVNSVGGGGAGGKHHRNSKEQKTTRVRTVLNEKQLHMLRTCYAANPRPDALMKEQLVEMTGLSPRVIRVWFQNKRCKDKKKQILIKQMEQHHQAGQISCTLQGVPMVASSPVPNDASMLNGGANVEIHQFPRATPCPLTTTTPTPNPTSTNPTSSSPSLSTGKVTETMTPTSATATTTMTTGVFWPSGKQQPKSDPDLSPNSQSAAPSKFPTTTTTTTASLFHGGAGGGGGQGTNGGAGVGVDNGNFVQLNQAQTHASSMHFSRHISQAT